jgi:nucleoside-diphosphate-sugar epimerase
MRSKILLTGGTGFVGRRFAEYNKHKFDIITVNLRQVSVEEIDFSGITAVVHMAGLAHQLKKTPAAAYFAVNTELTELLARRAEASGVPQFIYISSVKVYGEGSSQVITEQTPCSPEDDYGKSKLAAEDILKKMENASFKVAIVRPPVIFGPYVKGNMLRIMRLVQKNRFLPFKGVNNKRSMIFVDNLVEFVNAIISKQQAGTFLPAEENPLSTEELINFIHQGFDSQSRLIKLPEPLVIIIKLMFPGLHKRLFGSFIIDNISSNKKLEFRSPYSTQYGILEMVKWFKNKK